MKIRIMIAVISLLVLFNSVLAGEQFLVIANQSIEDNRLAPSTISKIYQGTKTKWDNGDIRVVMLRRGPTHENFVRDIVGSTPSKLRNFWKKVLFTGMGTPPRIFKKEADLVEFVAKTKGSIGYITNSTPHQGVKVIALK